MAAPLGRVSGLRVISLFARRNLLQNSFTERVRHVRLFNTRELKKFYKTATITQDDGWFEINLDQRKLKTPGGNNFRVPNKALALAVATEWNAQEKEVKRHSMHLTSLCNTAIDNPMQRTRTDLINSIIHFLESDTVSYRESEPADLVKLQQQEWDPVVDWIEKRYDITVPVVTHITDGQDLSERTIDTLAAHMESHNTWALFGYNYAVETVKSLVLVLALMDKNINVEKCVHLSRLEQDYQIQRWGNVEWSHDMDRFELRCRLSAATLFVNWSNEEHVLKKRTDLIKEYKL